MQYFFVRAEMRKHTNDKPHLIDADYENAAHLASLVAPYRHARLSAVKLAEDPNNPVRFKDDATADELRAELTKRLRLLVSVGLIDLKTGSRRRSIADQRRVTFLIANCVDRCHPAQCCLCQTVPASISAKV